MFDLEVWLIGSPAELDAAARVLAAIGTVVDHGTRTPLASADAGRWRTYARIRVSPASLASRSATPDDPTALPELAA